MEQMDFENLSAEDVQVQLVQSTVVGVAPLRLKGGYDGQVAASCLVQPELGDTVVCIRGVDADQPADQPRAVTVQGDELPAQAKTAVVIAIVSRLNSTAPLRVTATVPLQIQTAGLELLAPRIEIHAQHVELNAGRLHQLVDRIDEAADYISSRVGTLFMHAKRSIKRVEELDETRAGHLRLESPALTEIHGAVTAISGEQLVKVQSKQIQLG
jgi:hypothetical protein